MKKLAVIGSPVQHSKSPQIHCGFAAACGLDITYEAIEVTPSTLATFMERARSGEFAGFNVTMPHKETIIDHLKTISGAAKACNSVNTVVFNDGLHGYSTDGIGTITALRRCTDTLDRKCALILGTGGAAKAAAFALSEAGATVTALSRRDAPPAIAGAETRPWRELQALSASADFIINATPLGMHDGSEFEDFAWLDAVKSDAVVFDFVYNPLETELLKAAKTRKIATIEGLQLLLFQAAASFELFTGAKVPESEITRQLDAFKV